MFVCVYEHTTTYNNCFLVGVFFLVPLFHTQMFVRNLLTTVLSGM